MVLRLKNDWAVQSIPQLKEWSGLSRRIRAGPESLQGPECLSVLTSTCNNNNNNNSRYLYSLSHVH